MVGRKDGAVPRTLVEVSNDETRLSSVAVDREKE